MKKLLFLIMFPLTWVNAQFIVDPLSPFLNPCKLNQKIDSNLYPAQNFFVDYYTIRSLTNDWMINCSYKIEFNNYLFTKKIRFIV